MERTRQRNLSLESLEPRLPLAGGLVTAALVDGDLVVRGDTARNEISIRPVLDDDYVAIPGALALYGMNGTKVNHPGRDRAYVEDFQGDIIISMPHGGYKVFVREYAGLDQRVAIPGNLIMLLGGKRDAPESRLRFDGADVAGNVFVKTYRGINFLSFNYTEIAGNVTAHTGRGRDQLSTLHSHVAGDFNVQGALGKGPVPKKATHADRTQLLHSTVDGNMSVKGVPGSNNVASLYDVEVAGMFKYSGGPTRDRVNLLWSDLGDVHVATRGNRDQLTLEQTSVDKVFANLGAGSDLVEFKDSSVVNARIWTARGADVVGALGATVANDFQVNTGHGNDTVFLGTDAAPVPRSPVWAHIDYWNTQAATGLVAGAARIVTGAGNDWVGVQRSQFARDTQIATGSGRDRVLLDDSTWDGSLRLESGSGFDAIDWLECQVAGQAVVLAGGGDDRLSATRNNVAGDLSIFMGAGRDRLSAESNSVTGETALDGGSEFDLLEKSDNDFGNPALIVGFEEVT